MKNLIKSESAASGAIGFALIFSIILISIGMVYVGGVPVLENTQKNTHFMQMEQSFGLMSDNINKVGFERAPVRNTELKIKGGTLTISHNSSITVNGTTFALGSIEYEFGEKILAYENGGLWTKYRDSTVVIISKPFISMGNLTTISAFSLIGSNSIGGEGIVRINSKFDSSYLYTLYPENGNISFVIKSDYYKGWANYMEEIGSNIIQIDDANNTVSGNITANRINVDYNLIQTTIV
jgi:hypothetical protein